MWLQGDVDGGERLEKDALRVIGELDERSGIALCLNALAWMAASRRDLERAAVLQGAATSVWESFPGRLPAPLSGYDERCGRLVLQGLGSHARRRLFEKGRKLHRAAAVAHGVGAQIPGAAAPAAPQRTGMLTNREREVAELVAVGLTDRDIAMRLMISPRTAESHVQHILTKLGFRSRSQIAAWVTRAPTYGATSTR